LTRTPVETVAGIYDAIGDSLAEEARIAIESYVAANGRAKFGVHGYNLAEFGLDAAQVAERFASYVARYDISHERA
jgi:hypothetical protein